MGFAGGFQVLEDSIGFWGAVAVCVAFELYILAKVAFGVIFLISSKLDYIVPFALFTTESPKFPIQNNAEKTAVLASLLYESSSVAIGSDTSDYKKIQQDPHFIPAYKLNSGRFYMNALDYAADPKISGGLADSISMSWGIEDRSEALSTLQALLDEANHNETIPVQQLEKFKDYDELIQSFGFQIPDQAKQTNSAGFDIVRLAYMSRVSFVCGYITEEEVRTSLQNTASFIHAHYDSWETLAYSYLVTYTKWAVENDMELSEIKTRILCVKQCLQTQNSLIHQNPLASLN